MAKSILYAGLAYEEVVRKYAQAVAGVYDAAAKSRRRRGLFSKCLC